MPSLKLSICVVLFESVEATKKFDTELRESLADHLEYEVLYFDNSRSDALQEWFSDRMEPGFQYQRDPRNLGFSYANNQLILRARYERILLLNPDVFGFTPAFWNNVVGLELNNEVRFARLLNEDGSYQDSIGEPSSLLRAFRRRPDYGAMTEPTSVGMGIMAFMLTSKTVFARVGLLDCDYSLYAEDMDWCYRARRAGVGLVYDPAWVLTHIGGASASDRWSRVKALRTKYRAERVFIDKHFRGLEWAAMRLLNVAKIALRAR